MTMPATYYQRDWVLACTDERSHFTTPLAWDLDGEFDSDVLLAALRTLTQRHESLRTSFRVCGPDVRQVVWSEVDIDLRTVDVADEGEVEARIIAETERPRVVSVAPLWHGLVFRLGRHRHVLALFVHHLVFDGWSHGVVHDELVRAYRSHAEGREPRLPHVSVRFGHYARWERERHDTELEHWWRGELADLPPILPPPPLGGRFVSVAVPPVPPAAVLALADAGAGASTALLAAVCAARRAGDDRDARDARDAIVIGVTRSGRERPRLQRIVGPLLDHVPVRVDLSGAPTFRELLGRVHRAYRGALAHQLPLGRIRRVLPATPGGRLFDTRFNYLPRSAVRSGDAGPVVITPRAIDPLRLAPRHTEEHPEVLPLSYILRHHPDGRLEGEVCGPDSMFPVSRLNAFAAELAEVVTRVGVDGLDRPVLVAR